LNKQEIVQEIAQEIACLHMI